MRIKNLLGSSVAVCVFLVGCGGKEAQFAGTWVGTDIKTGNDVPAALAAMLKQKASAFTLDLKQDRHFTMTQETGLWSVKDDHLILKVESIAGKTPAEMKKELDEKLKGVSLEMKAQAENSFSEEQTGTLSPDGKTLTVIIGKISVVFSKKAA